MQIRDIGDTTWPGIRSVSGELEEVHKMEQKGWDFMKEDQDVMLGNLSRWRPSSSG